jgi:glycosyltransferase involved in cell wall biosynthesis
MVASGTYSHKNSSPPIRVLHLIHHLHVGGAEHSFAQLLVRLHRTPSLRVEAAVLQRGGELETLLCQAGVRLHRLQKKSRSTVLTLRGLRRILRQGAYDVLHMHDFSASLWGRLAVIGTKTPVRIVTCHAVEGWKNPLKHGVCDFLLKPYTTLFTTVSAAGRTALLNRDPSLSDRVIVVPNGFDRSVFYPDNAGRTSLLSSVPDGMPVVGMVGRCSVEKGGDVLIDALELLSRQGREITVVIVGDGPERERWEKRVRGYGQARKVLFTGALPHKDVARLINRFDICIAPSREDSCSLAVLEHMACGKAVIATRVGGTPEVIDHGRTGILVAPEDPAALASAIHELLAEPKVMSDLGRRAHQTAVMSFSWDRVCERYTELYTTLHG